MLFKQEGWAQKEDKIYITSPILHAGMDKNGYYWNREALESLGRDWCSLDQDSYLKVEYRDITGIPHEIGIIYNLELTDEGYLIACMELDKAKMAGIGLDPSKVDGINFAGCVAVEYKLDKVENFDKLAFDLPEKK